MSWPPLDWWSDRLGQSPLTQLKNNRPTLCRKLALGGAGRKLSGCAARKSKGRNLWEAQELMVFPAKALFHHSSMGGAD
jgi:hypothetical protein